MERPAPSPELGKKTPQVGKNKRVIAVATILIVACIAVIAIFVLGLVTSLELLH